MVTKNDTYHQLIQLGIKQKFVVIPEFRVFIKEINLIPEHTKNIDLVWLRPKSPANTFQEDYWEKHWDMVAAFEIDACDVPIKKEFYRHLRDLPLIKNKDKKKKIVSFVALYTTAFDRRKIPSKNNAAQIQERFDLAQEKKVFVFSMLENDWEDKILKQIQN